ARAILDDAARQRLRPVLSRLEALKSWTPAETEAAVRAAAEEAGIKLGLIAQPLRAALTGRSTSPGLFDVMDVLGREECLARLRDQVR
ncbi:MAG: glutamate--tRNA ligase, partial [Pseudomonadota bacterium]